MVVGVNAITYAMAGVTARHLASGLSLMWMESVVLLSVTFAFATYFSTALLPVEFDPVGGIGRELNFARLRSKPGYSSGLPKTF